MGLNKVLRLLVTGCLMTAIPANSIPTSYAQEIGRWIGRTSQGFQFVFTITPERTIETIQTGYIETCPSGFAEEVPNLSMGRFPGVPIVDQSFVWGGPARDAQSFTNDLIRGEFTSPTEATGTWESVTPRFRVDEKSVDAQLCCIGHVTWHASFQVDSKDLEDTEFFYGFGTKESRLFSRLRWKREVLRTVEMKIGTD